MRGALLVVVLVLASGGCASESRIELRYEEKLTSWKVLNPTAELTKEQAEILWTEAEAEVAKEVAEERKEAAGHATGALSAALSGNFVAVAWHVVGLAGLGLGAYKASKKKAVA